MDTQGRHLEPVCGLMPVRNAMPYLRETLASIAAQTYPAFRLIAWDNGSQDGSGEELHRWIPERIPGQVITGRPLPLGRCRAALIERADCERCAWFDADDLYRPERIAIQSRMMDHEPDAALIGTAMNVIDQDGRPTGETRRAEREDAAIRWALRFGNPIAQPAVMLRRSAVLAVGNYPDLPGEEDYEMWLRLSLRFKLINLDQVLVDYRVHDRNITHRFDHNRQRHLRERKQRLHGILFPGFGLDETQRLYDSLCPHELCDVSRDDLDRLERSAACLADATGMPLSAIRQARVFREQRSNLRTRVLKQRAGLRQVWPALQFVKRLIQPAHPLRGWKEALDG